MFWETFVFFNSIWKTYILDGMTFMILSEFNNWDTFPVKFVANMVRN